jgi:hypothetical protein
MTRVMPNGLPGVKHATEGIVTSAHPAVHELPTEIRVAEPPMPVNHSQSPLAQ